MDKLIANFNSIKLEDSWQLWLYECNDFPNHKCFAKSCGFCKQVELLKHLSKNTCEESGDRWMNYIKKDCFHKSSSTLIRSIEFAVGRKDDLLPSQLAKHIFFNKKFGRAFFREGIPPNYEDPQNNKGGNFQLLLLGTTGNINLLKDFDKIFLICLKNLIDDEGSIDGRLNGIFLRCEMNPGKFLDKNIDNYKDLKNLPFMVKIELWIRDEFKDLKSFRSTVIKNIEEQINKQINFPNEKTMRHFEFHNHRMRKEVIKKIESIRKLKIEKEEKIFKRN